MAIIFHWDRRKALSNAAKTVFADALSVTVPDPRHSDGEDRSVVFGQSDRERLLAVMFTERRGTIRVISARMMTSRERREYENKGEFDV